jgi:hypothetical protein
MSLVIGDSEGRIIAIGVNLGVTVNASARVSDHPVEQGAAISDHVQPQPTELLARLGVSDTPVNGEQAPGQVREALDALGEAFEQARVLTVATLDEVFIGYAINRIGHSTGGSGRVIELGLRRIIQVEGAQVDVPAEILAALVRPSAKSKPTTQQASRAATQPEAAQGRKTWLKGGKDAVDRFRQRSS